MKPTSDQVARGIIHAQGAAGSVGCMLWELLVLAAGAGLWKGWSAVAVTFFAGIAVIFLSIRSREANLLIACAATVAWAYLAAQLGQWISGTEAAVALGCIAAFLAFVVHYSVWS